ncbi:MAG: sulfotransferase family protein [Limnothrix sp. RL_2_0]|nr:sulfotransferase family protein [Limnothrix sp. RL_2_0]
MAIIVPNHKLLFIMVPATGCSSIGEILQEKFGGEYIPKKNLYKDKKVLLPSKHNTIAGLRKYNCLSSNELSNLLKFGTVRNPFDIFATQYQRFIGEWSDISLGLQERKLGKALSKEEEEAIKFSLENRRKTIAKTKEKSFDEWLEDSLSAIYDKRNNLMYKSKSQLKALITSHYYPDACPMVSGVDEIIRYESLEKDFNAILRKVGSINSNEYIEVPNNNPTQGKKKYCEYYSAYSRNLVEKYLGKDLEALGYNF